MRPSSCNDARLTFYMMLKCIYTLVTLHKSKLPECIYTEGHIAFIPGWFALKHMYMSDCTFAMSDCINQMLEMLRVDYISGGLYQLKMCKRAGTVHISCSGSYLIVPFIHVFRVPLVWHLSRLFVSLFKDSSRTLLPSVLLPWTEVSSTSYFYHKEQ